MNERLERTRKPNKLIINSPFVEPGEHWKYNRTMGHFDRLKCRRPGGYFVASPKSKSFDDFGLFVELPLVNKIRPLVEQWRQNNYYPGATNVTRRLLEHWYDAELREGKQFFYCQLEAIETIIWLTECPTKECAAIREEIVGDGGPFERWCSKLATGTGKTVVMAMLIAWQVLNRCSGHNDGKYSKNVLIIAPGLTVKDRLGVLIPESDGNMYDEFNVIPVGMHQQFRQGKVFIQNWHQLGWQTEEKIAKRKSVDKRGALSDEAWVRAVMGDMAFARTSSLSTMRHTTRGEFHLTQRRTTTPKVTWKTQPNGSAVSIEFIRHDGLACASIFLRLRLYLLARNVTRRTVSSVGSSVISD